MDEYVSLPIVNPGRPEVAHFRWKLPPEAMRHSCIVVFTDAVDDPLMPGGELDTGVLASRDRHVAVRNLTLLTCAPEAPVGVYPTRHRPGSRAGVSSQKTSRRP